MHQFLTPRPGVRSGLSGKRLLMDGRPFVQRFEEPFLLAVMHRDIGLCVGEMARRHFAMKLSKRRDTLGMYLPVEPSYITERMCMLWRFVFLARLAADVGDK